MHKQKYLDIVKILSKKNVQLLFDGTLKGKLYRKKFIIQAFLKGEVKLKETFWSLMPENFRPQKILGNWNEDLDITLIFNHLFGDCPIEPLNLQGLKIYYLPKTKLSKRDIYMHLFAITTLIKDIYIHDQYCAKNFINKSSRVIIDAGANIGVFSLFAKKLAPQATIYSFEPSPKTFQFLKYNLEKNSINEIEIYQQALGNRIGKTSLMIGGSALEASNMIFDSEFLEKNKDLFEKSKTISINTIDNFVRERDLKYVDFIKIDTEGYEKQIIEGAKETIKKLSPVIACSAYHLQKDKTEIPKLVLSMNKNYKWKLLKRAEEDLIFWPKK